MLDVLVSCIFLFNTLFLFIMFEFIRSPSWKETLWVLIISFSLTSFNVELVLFTRLFGPDVVCRMSNTLWTRLFIILFCTVRMGRKILGWLPAAGDRTNQLIALTSCHVTLVTSPLQDAAAVWSDAVCHVYLICTDSKRMFGGLTKICSFFPVFFLLFVQMLPRCWMRAGGATGEAGSSSVPLRWLVVTGHAGLWPQTLKTLAVDLWMDVWTCWWTNFPHPQKNLKKMFKREISICQLCFFFLSFFFF